MVNPPKRAKVGDRLSAGFLNYCRDGVAAQNSLRAGFLETGTHATRIGNNTAALFKALPTEDLQPYSIFGLKEATETPYAETVKTGVKSHFYSNGEYACSTGVEFTPYPLTAYGIYQLLTSAADAPVAGDLCTQDSGTWVVKKGGISLLCILAPDANNLGWYLVLPTGSSKQAVGFVIDNDIAPQSAGVVELYDKNNTPNGTEITVFNPHDVSFYKENTTPGEEHAADRVILFEVDGWPEPLIFPFMLSECEDLKPVFDPVDV